MSPRPVPFPVATGAALPLLASLAVAQVGHDLEGGEVGFYLPYDDGALPVAAFERGVAADVHGDGLRDAIWRIGDELFVMVAPGLFGAPMDNVTDGGVRDHDVGRDGDADVIYTVGADGAKRVSWDQAAFDQHLNPWDHELLFGGVWRDAVLVRRALDGGVETLIGVIDDGDGTATVRRLALHPTRAVDSVLFGVPAVPTDMELLDWEADGVLDVALAYADGVRVHSGDTASLGTLLAAPVLTVGEETHSIAAGRQSGGHGWLAWTSNDGANGRLRVVHVGGVEGPFTWTGRPVGGVACGDADDDGEADVILAHQDEDVLQILWNLDSGTSPSFGLGSGECRELALPLASTTGLLDADPLLMDLDNDWDEDLSVPVQSRAEIFFAKSSAVDHEAMTPSVLEDAYSEEHEFTVDAQRVTEFTIVHGAPPPAATDLQVKVWVRPDAAPATPLDVNALQTRYSPLHVGGSTLPGDEEVFTADLAPYVDGTNPYNGEDPPHFEELFFFTLRYVERDASGAVTFVFPGVPYGIEAAQPLDDTNAVWLAESFLRDPLDGVLTVLIETGSQGQTLQGDETGDGGPGLCVPCKQNCPPNDP